MIDADLPPLQQPLPIAGPAFTMRCMSDEEIRGIQREAFKAGMEKAARVCDLMGRTSPRKPFREASAWLAQRIRVEKSDSTKGDAKADRPLTGCAANRDGECSHAQCPQLRDKEPNATGRHCPLDNAPDCD